MNSRCLLLSGGVDSACLLKWKYPQIALFIDYGQPPAKREFEAAKSLCKDFSIPLKKITLPIYKSQVIKNGEHWIHSEFNEWYPFRNQFLVTIGAIFCQTNSIKNLLIGSVSTDSHYKDGTKKFYSNLVDLVSYQEGQINIECPAIDMTSLELINISCILNETLLKTYSCTMSKNYACGKCKSCQKRRQIFYKIGLL